MTLLPTITWGGQEFYNIAGIVTADRYTRPGTDGVAYHHTVAQTEFPDKNMNGTSLDEQIEHVKNINQYHIQQNYGGFGYNAIVFRDGTAMTVGNGSGARAHVANHNDHLFGVVLAGDFSTREVPIGCILGVARVLAAAVATYGPDSVKGHRQWVTDPTWATSCPGDQGIASIGRALMARDAIIRKSNEAADIEVRRIIANALRKATEAGDLVTLAGQIKFISGGRLC